MKKITEKQLEKSNDFREFVEEHKDKVGGDVASDIKDLQEDYFKKGFEVDLGVMKRVFYKIKADLSNEQ